MALHGATSLFGPSASDGTSIDLAIHPGNQIDRHAKSGAKSRLPVALLAGARVNARVK